MINNQEIIAICQQLSQQGKAPSVALIKARLSTPVPMPLIIGGLKQWRANPNIELPQTEQKQETTSAPTESLEQRVNALEVEVKQLKQIITKLLGESEQ